MAYKNTCPTLKKVADDEPIFVLRAQDFTAPEVIRQWIQFNLQAPAEKLAEAEACANAMMVWHYRKLAD